MARPSSLLTRLAGTRARVRPAPLGQAGFTLLEVIIAMTIMVLAFASILAVESNSINATVRAREMNIVAMLARGKMVDLEYRVEGKTFEEVKAEDGGTFEAPYQGYRWKTEIKEIKFPNMNFAAGGDKNDEGGNQYAELLGKLITNYFTKAIREMSVTIFWKRGSGEVSYTVSTWWVDLNHEFQTSE